MEQKNEAIVYNDLEDVLNEDIEYRELMKQVDEVIGTDQPAEEADVVAAVSEEEAEQSDEPMVKQEVIERPREEQEPVPAVPVKRGKKPLWALVIVVGVLVAGYFGLCAYADSLDTFYPGQAINGVDVSGMTVSQAQQALEEALSAQNVTLLHEGTGEVLAEVPLMELGYDVEDFAEDAQFWMDDLHRYSFPEKGWVYLNFLLGRWPGGSNWPDADQAERMETVRAIAQQLKEEAIDADYAFGQNTICITKARDGRRLNVPQLAAVLGDTDMYRDGYRAEIGFESIPAQTFTAQELYDRLYGTMHNATYDRETDSILPEQVGVDFNVTAAQAALNGAEPGSTVVVDAVVEQPAVTAAHLKEVLFRDVLGEWKTHVSGTAARINNVKLSASTINGYVMNSGDAFSYNEAVGQRTAANGYQAAPAYIRGETVDEIGGGICQTSSTLYYACLLAQVEIVERYPHRYVPAYIPWGMDATVSWGGPDYKFANNSEYPIKIVTEYAKNYLTVKILGTRTLDTTVKMTNQVVSTTPWTTVYEVDETLTPGTPETVKTSPYTGYKVLAYRNLYDKDGKLISTTLESTNNYKVRNKVIVQAPPAPGAQIPVITDPVTGEVEVVAPGQVPDQTWPEEPAPSQPAPEETEPTQPADGVVPEQPVEVSTPAEPIVEEA